MSTEPMAVILNTQTIVKNSFIQAVSKLKRDETLSWVGIKAEFTGRPDGQMKMEYVVYDNEYSPEKGVRGFNLDAAVEEILRRRGYDKTHAPLMISSSNIVDETVTPASSDFDDLPF